MKICKCGAKNIDKAIFCKNSEKKMPLKMKERSEVLYSPSRVRLVLMSDYSASIYDKIRMRISLLIGFISVVYFESFLAGAG